MCRCSRATSRASRSGRSPTETGLRSRPCAAATPAASGLARVDATQHVLVAYLDGDPAPAGIARLTRDGGVGEMAIVVADPCRRRGIGRVLARALAADARAAGITVVETACGSDEPVVSVLARSRLRRERPYATSCTASTPGS